MSEPGKPREPREPTKHELYNTLRRTMELKMLDAWEDDGLITAAQHDDFFDLRNKAYEQIYGETFDAMIQRRTKK